MSGPNHVMQRAAILSDAELEALPHQVIDEVPGEEFDDLPPHIERRVGAQRPLAEAGNFEPDLGGLTESVLSLSALATVAPTHTTSSQYDVGASGYRI